LTDVSVDAVMAELQARVRERLRQQLAEQGADAAYQNPQLFADVERLLAAAVHADDRTPLILPELLGDPETWRLRVAMQYDTHRRHALGAAIRFTKRRVLMPVLRWLFEYSRDNFERQRRVNQVLFACVQELALETARLRQELQQRPRE
jgi:hypothetical protein